VKGEGVAYVYMICTRVAGAGLLGWGGFGWWSEAEWGGM